ncbi:MAG: GTP-binding protein [Betaproteobacteria bacterium]|nr:GTP-binding protein [Betaproteobacteria bacterium]
MSEASRKIPVTILTGFLGAGKTTLLNHLLRQPEMADTAVLINEFGETGLDHHLVEKVDENLVLLDSGCLCCSVRGDLVRALKDLAQRVQRREIKALKRVLIETTGLADPAPVLHTLMEDFYIADRYRTDGVITAVDATHADAQLSRHFEAVKQVTMADRLLLTKTDLVTDPEALARLERRLQRHNPGAPRHPVVHGQVEAAWFLDVGSFDPAAKGPEVARWLADEAVKATRANHHGHDHDPNRHDALVHAFTLRFSEPLVWGDFLEALDVLLATCGDRLLRVKGLVHVAGEAQPRVVHCVQHTRYPTALLDQWPEQVPYNDRSTRLVFIVQGLARDQVEKAFTMFCGGIRDADTPPATTPP